VIQSVSCGILSSTRVKTSYTILKVQGRPPDCQISNPIQVFRYNDNVSTPILATKLFIPTPRPNLVPRPRLVELFKRGLDRKLTLVSAPTGFGKTTLLSECLKTCGLAVAWISLDDGDNDQTRFLSYFISALKVVSGDFGESVREALYASQPPGIEILLAGLINEIVEIHKPMVVLLDDYHVITNPEIHDMLTFIVENQPPAMHLVVSGRADPPWPLARWRARREMVEIRTQDLRFTPDEVACLLNGIMQFDLSGEDLLRLGNRTEGWIAGLQLAAISIQGRADVSGYIRAFAGSNRFIFDYLIEEIIEQLPPDIQDQDFRLAVVFTRSTYPYEKVPWPANLDDDCIKPTPGGFPATLAFSPDEWGILTLTNPGE
jgi:LuxR family maltose regulon positive regulatory protein